MIYRSLLAFVVMSGLNSVASADTRSVLVQAPVDKVFVPQGFDDNDKVEVVVHGHFTSSCYKMGPVSGVVDTANKKILVTAEAYHYPGAVCAEMLVPFIKSVELTGSVAVGSYKIEVVNRPQAVTTPLNVTKATRADADDFLYAAVNFASVEEKANGERELVLKGQHPFLLRGCVKFEQVKTSLNPSDVLVVQPITRIEEDEDLCSGAVNNRFEYRAPLKTVLGKGEYVMHVRVLDGNAINQFLDFN